MMCRLFKNTEDPQTSSPLLGELLPDELVLMILSFFDVEDRNAIARFILTSQKARRLGNDQLTHIYFKFKNERLPEPVKALLINSLNLPPNQFDEGALALRQENPQSFENMVHISRQVYQLEEVRVNPDLRNDRSLLGILAACSFISGVFIFIIASMVLIIRAIDKADVKENSTKVVAISYCVALGEMILALCCAIAKCHADALLNALEESKKDLSTQSGRMTGNNAHLLPPVSIDQNDGKPNHDPDVDERSSLLV